VEPEHRLVARELEHRWDERFRVQEQLEADHARFGRACPTQLSPEEREQVLALANDLPALWQAGTTTPQDRQTIARLLVEQITVTVEGQSDRVEVELRWVGGFVSHHMLLRPVQTYAQLSHYDERVARIAVLRSERKTLGEIAATLNAEGFHPPMRSPRFTAALLSRLLRERGVRTGPLPRSVTGGQHLETDEWWLADLAAKLSMPITTLHRWQRVGWVRSRKVPRRAVAGPSSPTPTNSTASAVSVPPREPGPNRTRKNSLPPKPERSKLDAPNQLVLESP
jgi:hypothetical protein